VRTRLVIFDDFKSPYQTTFGASILTVTQITGIERVSSAVGKLKSLRFAGFELSCGCAL
jgi:hypothetical protein